MPMNAFTHPSLSTTVQFYTTWSDLLGDSINPVRPHEPRPPRQNFETHFEISQSQPRDQITETAFHSLSAIYREMSAVASRSGCSKSLHRWL